MNARVAGFVLIAGGLAFAGLAVRQSLSSRASAAPPPAAAAPPAAPAPAAPATAAPLVAYAAEVVTVFPHDPEAFTQGLVFLDGVLLESTGLNGHSTLRRVELATGRVLQKVTVPAEYFGEGLAVLGGKIFQLTWQNQKGFIYDLATLKLEGEFRYEGEGWGLATDGESLILSDGSNRLRFLDPKTFAVKRTVAVELQGRPLERLNELEFIKGEVFANVWGADVIVRIDPASGAVTGVIDLTGLLPVMDRSPGTDVLNGIAYDATADRIFVTGKKWPRLFEIRLKRK